MLVVLLAVTVLQLLHALDGYVVVRHDGYYPWRTSTSPAPQYYYYYPYYWGHPSLNTGDVSDIRRTQKNILDVLKCVIEEESKPLCKKMLDEIMPPITIKKPEVELSQPKPAPEIADPPTPAPDTPETLKDVNTVNKEAPVEVTPMESKQDPMPADVNTAFTSS